MNFLLFSILILIAAGVVYWFVWVSSKDQTDDFSGNPLNPVQIKRRRENLEKIMQLAQGRFRLTNDDVQKALGVSDATAIRYLSYLVDLGKLIRVGERGQQVYYQLPPS